MSFNTTLRAKLGLVIGIGSTLVLGAGSMAVAETTPAGTLVSSLRLAQNGQSYLFNIPPKPLPQAIADFSSVTGIQVLYTERSTFEHVAPALRGDFTADEALQRLLDGTPLKYRFTSDDAITIELAAQSTSPESVSLGTLTVYGAKTTSTLNDTTSSVGIVTAEEIQNHEIRSFRDAFRTLGNVMDADWNDAGFIIRGINSEGLTPGGAPLASLYIDGVPQTVNGARRGARGLWDVEQVEVYRGPQSTLSGRAALAGAIYVKTADPSFEPVARAQITAGTMETRGAAFTLGSPLGDQIAVRFAGEYQVSENGINYPSYEDFDHYDEFVEDKYHQLRGKVLFLPESLPATSALFTYSRSYDSPDIDDIAGPELEFEYDEERGDFNLPVWAEARIAETDNLSLEVEHELSASLLFTSLTTYSYTDMDRSSVNKGTPGETNYTDGDAKQSVAAQEFRLNYDAGAWQNVGGIYLAKAVSQYEYRRPDYFGNSDISHNEDESFNTALFGETAYEFTPSWKIILGARLDYFYQTNSSFFSRNGTATVDREMDFNEEVLLPKFGLVKQLNPDETLGFTVQKGFRNGGSGVQTSTGSVYTYDPEFLWNYEFSYKGSFLANRLQLSANVFYGKWNDQQVEISEIPGNSATNYITNAGNSNLKGFELEGRYQATEQLSSFASLGYVDTEFTDFDDVTLGDLSGYPFPEAPEWNLALGVFYEHLSGFFIGGDMKYLSRYLARFANDPQEYLDGYTIANAQLGYRTRSWDVTLWAENLFDKEYFVYNDATPAGDVAATLGEGRVVGVTVTTSF